MKVKFLADENLRRPIVLGVRRRESGVSFVEAFEVGAVGKRDPAVLRGWRSAKLCGVEARQLAKRRAGALRQPATGFANTAAESLFAPDSLVKFF